MEGEVRFYNMSIRLLQNNRLFEEKAAIKKVWKQDGNVFFDIYFYRNHKSYVFDSHFVHDLTDLVNERYYKTVEEFWKDYQKQETSSLNGTESEEQKNKLKIDKKLFEPLDVDLIIMVFLAGCEKKYNEVKKNIIYDYILEHIPETKGLSKQYINTYLSSLKAEEEEFYQALKRIIKKTPEDAENLAKEAVKICLADGRMGYKEKMYLAEIFQSLREQGINPSVGF